MPFEDVASRLEDILDAVQNVQQFAAGRSFEDYRTDIMLRLAIERCIEIVSEASRHIPAQMKAEHPSVPWQNVADIGNVLRHGYQSIDPQDHVGGRHTPSEQLAGGRGTDAARDRRGRQNPLSAIAVSAPCRPSC
jgi:uncharacterized protein with HEPN domain